MMTHIITRRDHRHEGYRTQGETVTPSNGEGLPPKEAPIVIWASSLRGCPHA